MHFLNVYNLFIFFYLFGKELMEVKFVLQVHADQARLEKSTAALREAKETAALALSRLPRLEVSSFDFYSCC